VPLFSGGFYKSPTYSALRCLCVFVLLKDTGEV